MVSLSTAGPDARALEPAAGEGVFLDSLADRGLEDVLGYELDESLVQSSRYDMVCQSFVSADLDPEFDLIIGNPPYVRWRDLDPMLKDELAESTLWNRYFTSLSDYLTIFIAKSVELLRPDGELIFITPSFWMHTQHSGALRDFMLERGAFSHVLHFGEATVFPGIATSIVIFRFVKDADRATEPIRHGRYSGPRKVALPAATYPELVAHGTFEEQLIPQFQPGRTWVLAPRDVQDRLRKLELACVSSANADEQTSLLERQPDLKVARLGDISEIANGMVSGLDAAFRLPDDVELNQRETDAIIPVAKGAHLSPYRVQKVTRYIFLTAEITEEELRSNYPAFHAQLEPFKERLKARYSYGRDLPYWEWAFLRSYARFRTASQLILTPCKERLSNKDYLRFALAPDGTYPTQDVTAIQLMPEVREASEFVLAQLNHPEIYEWVRFKGLMKGAVAEFSERPLSRIPIRRIDWDDEREIQVHDRVVELSRSAIRSDDPDLRHEIATLLDPLLGLS